MLFRPSIAAPALLQVDPKTLGLNLCLIISGLFVLTLAGAFTYASWTGIKTWIAIVRTRRGREEYLRKFRRADGKPYPPATHGKCEHCGVQQGKIYHVDSGPCVCPDCYEIYWRRETGWVDENQSG